MRSDRDLQHLKRFKEWLDVNPDPGGFPRLEVKNGNSRQLHGLVWNRQCVGEEGHGTIR